MLIYFVSNLGMGASPTGAVVALSFRQTLFAKLASIAGLADIVGTAIYRGQLPQAHKLQRDGPAVTFAVVSMPRGQVLGGLDGTAMARVQITAWDQGVDDAVDNVDAITLAILESLSVVPPSNPWGGNEGAVEIRSVTHQDETDQDEGPKSGSDQWLYEQVSEFNISYWI